MKYRKIPVVIEAFKFGVDDFPEWFNDVVDTAMILSISNNACIIRTLEGDHRARKGDYIIKGVKGELYPCKPDIFEMTYEKVD